MSSKISVIIPAYNVGEFLAEAIRSVLNQTRQPDEIIVIDDCSIDDTVGVAAAFHDPRCKVISTVKNSGSAAARNLGISTATGELIALLDGDDIWLDRHLELVAGLLDNHPSAVLAFSCTEAFGIQQWVWPMRLPPNEPVNCFWECLADVIIPQTNAVFRRDAFLAIGGYRIQMRQTQDFDLFLRLAYRHRFICTHEITTRYRRHQGSITWRRPQTGLHGRHLARYRFWEENRQRMDPEMLVRYEKTVREIWVSQISACASRFDFEGLDFFLNQHPLIPGAAEPYRKWRKLRRMQRIRHLWELLPEPLRNAIKGRTYITKAD